MNNAQPGAPVPASILPRLPPGKNASRRSRPRLGTTRSRDANVCRDYLTLAVLLPKLHRSESGQLSSACNPCGSRCSSIKEPALRRNYANRR